MLIIWLYKIRLNIWDLQGRFKKGCANSPPPCRKIAHGCRIKDESRDVINKGKENNFLIFKHSNNKPTFENTNQIINL